MIPIYKLIEWVEEYRELWDNFVDWIMPPYFEIEPSRIHMLKMAQAYNVIIPKHSLSKLENAMQFYCIDPNVKDIKMEEFDIITWYLLNYNPHGVSMLRKYPEYINWSPLSKNPAAIDILEQNVEKIDWQMLSANPSAIHLLEQNMDKIDWMALVCNPGAIDMLKNNVDKIYWPLLSTNSAIFELDKEAMRQQMQPIAQELMERVYHPGRVRRILEQYEYDILEEEYVTDQTVMV